MALENALKHSGAIPATPQPKNPTAFEREIDKIKYRIGVVPYKQ